MRFPLRLLIAFLPVTLTVLLLTVYLQVNPLDAVPVWRDEVSYWHQIKTFSEVGFNGGYYSYEEIPASATFSRFGAHGPAFIGVFGLVTRLTGWQYATLPLYNFALITGAFALFVIVVPLTRRQLLILVLFISTAWGLLFFLPASLQETLHFSIATVSAAIFYHQLSSAEPLSRRWKVAFVLFFIIAGLVKLTWTFMLLPLLLFESKTQRERWLSIFFAGVVIAAQFLLFSYWGSPYPLNYARVLLRTLLRSPLEGLGLSLWYFGLNLRRMRLGHPLEIIQRYEILSLIIALMISLVASKRRQGLWKKVRVWLPLSPQEAVFHLFNLALIFFLQLLLYDVFAWRDYRVFVPHLFLTTLLLIALNRQRLVLIIIAVNLLCIGWFFHVYQDFATNREGIYENEWYPRYESLDNLTEFEQFTRLHIVYDPAFSNAWCNTLLTDDFYPQLITLPSGIGFGITIDPEAFKKPILSRYLLFNPENFGTFGVDVRVQKLTATEVGDLYLNLAADCGA